MFPKEGFYLVRSCNKKYIINSTKTILFIYLDHQENITVEFLEKIINLKKFVYRFYCNTNSVGIM